MSSNVVRLPVPGGAARIAVELLLAMKREHGEAYALEAAEEFLNACASVLARERGVDFVLGYFDVLRGILERKLG